MEDICSFLSISPLLSRQSLYQDVDTLEEDMILMRQSHSPILVSNLEAQSLVLSVLLEIRDLAFSSEESEAPHESLRQWAEVTRDRNPIPSGF